MNPPEYKDVPSWMIPKVWTTMTETMSTRVKDATKKAWPALYRPRFTVPDARMICRIFKVRGKPYTPSEDDDDVPLDAGPLVVLPGPHHSIITPGRCSGRVWASLMCPGADCSLYASPVSGTVRVETVHEPCVSPASIVMHLNDGHGLSREEIADFLESIGL